MAGVAALIEGLLDLFRWLAQTVAGFFFLALEHDNGHCPLVMVGHRLGLRYRLELVHRVSNLGVVRPLLYPGCPYHPPH